MQACKRLTSLAGRVTGALGVGRASNPAWAALQRASQRGAAAASGAAARRWPRRSAAASAAQEARGSQPDHQHAEMDLQLPTHCSGCGVGLQQDDPEGPGFFQVPKKLLERLAAEGAMGGGDGGWDEDDSELVSDDAGPEDYLDDAAAAAAAAEEQPSTSGREPEEDAKWSAFDAMVESWLGGSSQPRVEVASYAEDEEGEGAASNVLCARCYSLRHYGQVKSAAAEADLPAFDFERKVGSKIQLQKFRRSVVLCVVDVADFDGSLPRAALRSILPPELRAPGAVDPTRAALPLGFRLIVAVNKADLLPKQVTPTRLERWVRKRMAQGGLPKPSTVHVVSSTKGRGVRELLADLQAAVGMRGDVWVVGAQNAGKSSLINAMRGTARLKRDKDVTTAPLPGTTLGMLRVPGLLPTGCKMLDTPGVPHAYQLGTHLTADEMRMVLPRRPLKPRTFRIGAGQTVMVGGLTRLDVVDSPGATLYLTVFASDEIGCHLGKTEGADERYRQHAGGKLAPPLGGEARLAGFPALVPTDVEVRGDSWKESSADVAIAGLGWVGVGVSGRAALRVWAPPGVAITTHDALVPDFARELERPGFGVALTDAGKSRVEEEAQQAKAAQQQAAKEAKRAEREAKQAAKAKAGAGEA